ncbi:MAG: chitobiase/beta-hexosaminidase C-terminal domain-containing protein [Clostridiales bacterium]|nr:chitobiase/beta-hexosaminidase C-terminal domain-containing protein [Clostridiales bacterium]
MKNKLYIPLILIAIVISIRLYNTFSPEAISDYDYKLLRAKEYKASGYINDSKETLLSAIDDDPQNPEAYIILGFIYMDENNYDGAERMFLHVLEDDPYSEEPLISLIGLYQQRGLNEELNKLLLDYKWHPVIANNKPVPPVCDKAGGEYGNKINISFKPPDDGKVLYTTDGSEPDYNSLEYDLPIPLGAGRHIVKAITVLGGLKSEPVTLEYFILNDYEELEFLNPDIEASVRNFLNSGSDILEESSLDGVESIFVMGSNIYFNINSGETKLKKGLVGGYMLESVSFKLGDEAQEFVYIPEGDLGGLYDIRNFKNLKRLYIFGQTEVDLSFVGGLSKLEELSLTNNSNLSNLNSLKKLGQLKGLELQNNGTYAFHIIPELVSLESLKISYNNLEGIDFAAGLSNLKNLDASDNQIVDVTPLSSLLNLSSLNLSNNKIEDIGPILKLHGLKGLYIKNNKIHDFNYIGQLGLEHFEG